MKKYLWFVFSRNLSRAINREAKPHAFRAKEYKICFFHLICFLYLQSIRNNVKFVKVIMQQKWINEVRSSFSIWIRYNTQSKLIHDLNRILIIHEHKKNHHIDEKNQCMNNGSSSLVYSMKIEENYWHYCDQSRILSNNHINRKYHSILF